MQTPRIYKNIQRNMNRSWQKYLLYMYGALAKSGALISSAGVALMITFAAVLLVFPVIKNCDQDGNCSYRSTAPPQLQSIVQPGFLAISLLVISAGVVALRFGRWQERNQANNKL